MVQDFLFLLAVIHNSGRTILFLTGEERGVGRIFFCIVTNSFVSIFFNKLTARYFFALLLASVFFCKSLEGIFFWVFAYPLPLKNGPSLTNTLSLSLSVGVGRIVVFIVCI